MAPSRTATACLSSTEPEASTGTTQRAQARNVSLMGEAPKQKAPPCAGLSAGGRRGYFLIDPPTSTSTRRLGARQSDSALRSFWSVQLLTGRVWP